MSIKGFSVNGAVQRYDYTALDNLPQGQGVSDDLKAALLQLAQKVAYIDDQGQTYYDDLYDALYPEKTLLSITANFQQGQAVVYNTDSLDSLKQYLTVTATYNDASTETVPSSAYTLSGTLTTGTSVITVTYEGKTDAFNVTVTAAPMSFTVTNTLTGCTTSNSATSVLENTSYTAVITASSGYTLVGATVSITMGGNDITTSAYSGGIITINSVTGALVISVAAVAVALNSISAVYTQSGTVYDTDTLDSLKADLVVTANYSDSSTQTVPAADYTLSGTLTFGTSTITVSYGGKSDTVQVVVDGLYRLQNSTSFNGTNIVDTGVQLNLGTVPKMSMAYTFTISTIDKKARHIWSTYKSGSTSGNSLACKRDNSHDYLWGYPLSWANGIDKASTNVTYKAVSIFDYDSGTGSYTRTLHLRKGSSAAEQFTATDNVQAAPETRDIAIGNAKYQNDSSWAGLVGTISDFRIIGHVMTSGEISDYLGA